MLFRLANTLSSLPSFINYVLYGMLNDFRLAYIDHILIYDNFQKKDWAHIRKALAALQKASLNPNIDQ